MGDCIFSGSTEPELEAGLAAWTAFRSLDLAQGTAPDIFQPGRVVIFIIDDFQSEGEGVAGEFVAAFHIFIERDDIGVAEEYSGVESFCNHPFQDGRGAGPAAAMEQDAVL